MFKHLILVLSLLLIVSCSENHSEEAISGSFASAINSDFKLASVGSPTLLDEVPGDVLSFIRTESIGGLKQGMTPKQLTEFLPCRVEKGEPILWAGIDEIVQEWIYADCGVKLQLSAVDNKTPQTVASIKVAAPSQLKTARDIGIGSSFSEVHEAYAEFVDEADNQAGETFMAGSTYGGLLIRFEKNRVISLFLGAGAE